MNRWLLLSTTALLTLSSCGVQSYSQKLRAASGVTSSDSSSSSSESSSVSSSPMPYQDASPLYPVADLPQDEVLNSSQEQSSATSSSVSSSARSSISSDSSSASSSASSSSTSPVSMHHPMIVTLPAVTPETANPLIKVLIFPHIHRWSAPAGQEKEIRQLRLTSKKPCTTYDGQDPELHQVISQASSLSFSTESLTSAIYLKCDSPVKLIRDSNLPAYEYQGLFYIEKVTSSLHGTYLQVIQLISLEDYLKGVTPSEMPSSWHPQALIAQAVAARSYALYEYQAEEKSKNTLKDYDLDDTIYYQAYTGLSHQAATSNQAVEDSKGTILTYGGQVIPAYFSADSGGYTESAQEEWGQKLNFTPSKKEVYDLALIKSDWTVKFNTNELKTQFHITKSIKSIGISDSDIDPSGRVDSVTFEMEDGSSKSISGSQIKSDLHLKSRLFTVSFDGQDLTIDGKGFGHGVGLNQTGAQVLARNMNWTAIQILNFYYEGAELKKLAP